LMRVLFVAHREFSQRRKGRQQLLILWHGASVLRHIPPCAHNRI